MITPLLYFVGLAGLWILSDAVYSILLYLTAESHTGNLQTWTRDHWVRVLRGIIGLFLVAVPFIV